MKSTFTIALFVVLLSSTLAFESCVTFVGHNAFNLCPFSKKDISFTVTTTTSETITFGIPDNHITSCDGAQNVYATEKTSDGTCYNISQVNPTFTSIDSFNTIKGLKITYPAVNISTNSAKQLIVALQCNMSANAISGTNFGTPVISSYGNTTIYTVTGESRYACSGSVNPFVEFIKDSRIIFGLILIGLGYLFAFRGCTLPAITTSILATIVGFAISGMLIFPIVDTTSKLILWALALLCLILGRVFEKIVAKSRKSEIFFVGAILGWLGGHMLYHSVINVILGNPSNSNILLVGTEALCAIVCGILSFKFQENLLIVSTSIVGSYMVLFAVALMTEKFYSQSVMSGDCEFGEYKYYYYGAVLLLAAQGIYSQWKKKSKKKEEIENDDYNYAIHMGRH